MASYRDMLPEPEMNTTPLIDVLLVLIVMLIMTVPILTHQTTLQLPVHDPNARPSPPPPVIHLDIDYDGGLYWDGQPVPSVAALSPRFAALSRQAGPSAPQLRVNPDRRTRYEIVAQVLASAQRHRVERIGITPIAD